MTITMQRYTDRTSFPGRSFTVHILVVEDGTGDTWAEIADDGNIKAAGAVATFVTEDEAFEYAQRLGDIAPKGGA